MPSRKAFFSRPEDETIFGALCRHGFRLRLCPYCGISQPHQPVPVKLLIAPPTTGNIPMFPSARAGPLLYKPVKIQSDCIDTMKLAMGGHGFETNEQHSDATSKQESGSAETMEKAGLGMQAIGRSVLGDVLAEDSREASEATRQDIMSVIATSKPDLEAQETTGEKPLR